MGEPLRRTRRVAPAWTLLLPGTPGEARAKRLGSLLLVPLQGQDKTTHLAHKVQKGKARASVTSVNYFPRNAVYFMCQIRAVQ